MRMSVGTKLEGSPVKRSLSVSGTCVVAEGTEVKSQQPALVEVAFECVSHSSLLWMSNCVSTGRFKLNALRFATAAG